MKIADIMDSPKVNKSLEKAGIETKRVSKGDIAATIQFVAQHLGVTTRQLHKVGSTGKLKSSGDIDVAIDSDKHSGPRIHHILQQLAKGQFKQHKGIGVTSYAIPIRGEEERGLVQFDVILTPNPEWAKFSYHSEGPDSKYKGAIRAILLAAVARSINKPGTDHIEYDPDDNGVNIHVGRAIDMSQGMKRIFKHRPMRKDGAGRLKNSKSMSIEDFKQMYPHVDLKGGQMNINDPEKVVNLLFGSNVTVNDVRSAEQILQIIRRKFDEKTQQQIFRYAAQRCKYLQGKMRLPPEIEEYLGQ